MDGVAQYIENSEDSHSDDRRHHREGVLRAIRDRSQCSRANQPLRGTAAAARYADRSYAADEQGQPGDDHRGSRATPRRSARTNSGFARRDYARYGHHGGNRQIAQSQIVGSGTPGDPDRRDDAAWIRTLRWSTESDGEPLRGPRVLWIVFHNQVFDVDHVRKERELARFVAVE